MLRSFLPVGQGAFYREVFQFDDGRHTLVYDCGSSTDRSIVEQQIENDFSKDEIIDAVFISHLDEDHINGLPFLLKYCRVQKLFFPLITTKDKVYLKLNALLSTGERGFLYHFIQNPYNALTSLRLNHSPHFFLISTEQDEGWNDIDAPRILSGDNVAGTLDLDLSEKMDWELIPFNFRQKDRIETLKAAIAEIFHCRGECSEENLEELICYSSENKDKLKEVYRRVRVNFNTNSMTLFSGRRDHRFSQSYALPKHFCCCNCCRKENGCLYLGDYDTSGAAKWEMLRKAYDKYWKYIGCIQIPHHGSSHNYNEEISNLDAINIISAGMKNSYRHPHSSVIKDLIMKDRTVHIVTENIGSQVDLKVDVP